MRLTELNPRWFTFANPGEGVHIFIGLTFICPHCRTQRLGVRFNPPIDPDGWTKKFGITWPVDDKTWSRTGDTFETLTLSPSIDASRAIAFENHWHGFITNGEVTWTESPEARSPLQSDFGQDDEAEVDGRL